MLRLYVRMCVCHVGNQVQVYLQVLVKFSSAFVLQLITFIPSGLQSWNFVWHLPTSRPFNVWYRCPRVMPLGGARGRGGGIRVLWTQFIFFLMLLKIDCGYSLEPPRRVPTIYVLSRNIIKKYQNFFIWNFCFFGCEIFSIYRRVFAMSADDINFFFNFLKNRFCDLMQIVSRLHEMSNLIF